MPDNRDDYFGKFGEKPIEPTFTRFTDDDDDDDYSLSFEDTKPVDKEYWSDREFRSGKEDTSDKKAPASFGPTSVYAFDDDDDDYDEDDDYDGSFDKGFDTYETTRADGRVLTRRETIERTAANYREGVLPPNPSRQREMPTDPRKTRKHNAPVGRRPRSNTGGNTTRRRRDSYDDQPSAKRKSQFTNFYITMLILGVGICLTIFIAVSQAVGRSGSGNSGNNSNINLPVQPTPAPVLPTIVRPDRRDFTAMVSEIDHFSDPRIITFMDVSDRRIRHFPVADNVSLSTRHGRPMTFGELRIGQLVEVAYDGNNQEVFIINDSVQAWEHRSRNNVQINIEESTATLGNQVFNFNSQTLITYRGELFSIAQITHNDTITMTGIGDTVWTITVDAAHGFLQLVNSDIVINGRIRVDTNNATNIFRSLEDVTEPITLIEGTHRIIIEGANIETFIQDITIEQGRTYDLNLGEVILRPARLHLHVQPSYAEIFINGELFDGTGPALLTFGEQHIRVESEGYLPQEQTIHIYRDNAHIQFDLVRIVRDYTLVIFTSPTNAQIFINNELVGYSTITVQVHPGTHHITARLPGHIDSNSSVYVAEGTTEAITRHLLLSTTVGNEWVVPPHVVEPIPTPTPQPAITPPPHHPGEHPQSTPFPTPQPTPAPTPSIPSLPTEPSPTLPPALPTPMPATPQPTPIPTPTPFQDLPELPPTPTPSPLPTLPPSIPPPPTDNTPLPPP